jgi:hypothetical protein
VIKTVVWKTTYNNKLLSLPFCRRNVSTLQPTIRREKQKFDLECVTPLYPPMYQVHPGSGLNISIEL